LFEDVLAAYGYLGVFAVSLAVNLLPFTSPSNLILAGAITFLFATMNPLYVGLAVAVAASLAKTAHYYVASFLGSKIRSRADTLGSYGSRLGKWGALATFVISATPIPDDPVVISLGITRYSPVKFFTAYLAGKILVSVAGAYLGRQSALALQTVLPSSEYIVVTAVVSILIAWVLVKGDLRALASEFKKAVKSCQEANTRQVKAKAKSDGGCSSV